MEYRVVWLGALEVRYLATRSALTWIKLHYSGVLKAALEDLENGGKGL